MRRSSKPPRAIFSIRWCRRSALARVVATRKATGEEPLTFGMTFPFSTHNYHLRFWMAAGGVDPDEDVRLVVLPPPYMVESLQNGHVDALLRRRAMEFGRGRSRHRPHPAFRFRDLRACHREIARRAPALGRGEPRIVLARLVRAHRRAADFVEDESNRDEVAALLAAPHRIGVDAEVIRRTLDGRLKVSPEGAYRSDARYLLVGRDGAARPDPAQAAWLYAQMVRWGQAPLSREMLAAAKAVCRPDLYDAALAGPSAPASSRRRDRGVRRTEVRS